MDRDAKLLSVRLDQGKRLIVLLMLLLQTLLVGVSLWPACWLLLNVGPRVHSSLGWTLLILGSIFVFNYAYIFALLGLRSLIPYPQEGFYPRGKDGRLPKQAIVYILNVSLVRLRLATPWARMFTAPLCDLPPLIALSRRLFGPKTTSVVPADSAFVLDPYLVSAGSNVQFGFACILTCHIFDQRGLFIKRITIGDDVLIGGDALICPGVQIGDHSVIAARSFVTPNTTIGSYEYWAGSPAVKVKDLRRPVEAAPQTSSASPAVLPDLPSEDNEATSSAS